MNELTFKRLPFDTDSDDTTIRESGTITFTLDDDATIHEFFVLCKRLAAAVGYTDNTIHEVFRNEDFIDRYGNDLSNSSVTKAFKRISKQAKVQPQKSFGEEMGVELSIQAHEKLMQVLHFYATQINWVPTWCPPDGNISAIDRDNGDAARVVLNELKRVPIKRNDGFVEMVKTSRENK